MAIFYPAESPVKFFNWSDRMSKAAEYESLGVHYLDDFHFQFWDLNYDSNRVILMDSTFTAVKELTGSELTIQTINNRSVYTGIFNWNSDFSEGDQVYIAVVDANDNIFFQNFLPNGDFESTDFWTLGSDLNITSSYLVFNGSATSTALYDNPIKQSVGYSIRVVYTNASGTITVNVKNGATTIASEVVSGMLGFIDATFTSVSDELSIEFVPTGSASVRIQNITLTMDYEFLVPQWISAPFCVSNRSNDMLIHCCANNDYFKTYYETTGYIPRVRISGELRDIAPNQEIEQFNSTSGNIVNYFVENLVQQELRIDWFPAYLVNFLSIVFYMDNGALDNVSYRAVERPETTAEDQLPDQLQMLIRIAQRENAVGFKRIVNDPSLATCTITTGGYQSQNTLEFYTSQNTGEIYYPQ